MKVGQCLSHLAASSPGSGKRQQQRADDANTGLTSFVPVRTDNLTILRIIPEMKAAVRNYLKEDCDLGDEERLSLKFIFMRNITFCETIPFRQPSSKRATLFDSNEGGGGGGGHRGLKPSVIRLT